MGEQPHVGLFRPAIAVGTSRRLPIGAISRFLGGCRGLITLPRLGDEHGAAFHRHVAPSGERGGPAAGKLGGAFWPARHGSGQSRYDGLGG